MTARLAPFLWHLALANLFANIGIVVTGAAVRLTASGLGCPTWPRCNETSYVPHSELGLHGVIEFGNRTLTFVLAAIAIATFLAALGSKDRRAIWLAFGVGLYIPAQAVIGGITVLTDLNPWVVSFHFLSSMVIIQLCVVLLDHLRSPDRDAAGSPSTALAWAVFALGWLVLQLGTVVTGSGPHAGDADARRIGLDPGTVSQWHAVAVYALVIATFVLWWSARRHGERWLAAMTALLLLVQVGQGVLGWVQYLLDLPVLLVALHMLGAGLMAAGTARVVLATRAQQRPADGLS